MRRSFRFLCNQIPLSTFTQLARAAPVQKSLPYPGCDSYNDLVFIRFTKTEDKHLDPKLSVSIYKVSLEQPFEEELLLGFNLSLDYFMKLVNNLTNEITISADPYAVQLKIINSEILSITPVSPY